MPASPPAQAHADSIVFAGTAGMQEPQAITYHKEKSGCKTQLTSRETWVHSLVLKRFVLPSEHDLYWDPGVVSSPAWPGSTNRLPL